MEGIREASEKAFPGRRKAKTPVEKQRNGCPG